MKLSYRAVGSPGSWTTLFDETAVAAGPVLEQFQPQFSQAVQQEALVRANAQYREPRGNISVAIPLPVWITYATRALALASIETWNGLLGTKWNFRVEQDATVHYYPNAVLTGYTPAQQGVSVLHMMQFISDNLTTTEPA